jgi:hypothetical protein
MTERHTAAARLNPCLFRFERGTVAFQCCCVAFDTHVPAFELGAACVAGTGPELG